MTVPLPRAAQPFLDFGRLLRRYGFSVAPSQTAGFLEAVGVLGPRSMEDIRQAALALLAPPPERRAVFDALFRAFFHGEVLATTPAGDEEETLLRDDGGEREKLAQSLLQQEGGAGASQAEQLAVRSFEASSADDALTRLQKQVAAALPQRRSFRRVRAKAGGRVDLRRSLAAIVRADGDIPSPELTRRQSLPRKLLLLIDISGSMKQHTADHLRLAHAVVQGAGRTEVFTLGTRLTRLTLPLRTRHRALALARAAAVVEDWDGGTRIGPTLLAFLAVPRFAAYARGAAIVILSDGLERGDPAAMGLALRRLSARAYRLSLATPLAADPRYRPATAALAASLPVLDDLVDGSSLAALSRFILGLGHPAPSAAILWRRA